MLLSWTKVLLPSLCVRGLGWLGFHEVPWGFHGVRVSCSILRACFFALHCSQYLLKTEAEWFKNDDIWALSDVGTAVIWATYGVSAARLIYSVQYQCKTSPAVIPNLIPFITSCRLTQIWSHLLIRFETQWVKLCLHWICANICNCF